MPIHPLPVLSEEEEIAAIEKLQPPKSVVVRYGLMKLVAELPYDGGLVLGCGTKLVVRTSRGVEIGEMLTTTCANAGCGKSISRQQMLQYIDNSGGKQYPFSTEGRVVRVAGIDDLNEWSRVQNERPRYTRIARDAVRQLDLPMKVVEVEPLFSRDRIIFYFTSESRIDFRELVRQLARELHVRVEMRQVGARDEARLVADYEKCGQQCCCKQFLKVLKPVSMRSAKIQKATLDPAKISGRCGRLMCCLRYEDETYDDLRKRLPPRNSRVMTDDGVGTVINSQILTQLVLVELDENGERNAYPVENIERLEGQAARRPPQPQEVDPPRGKRPRREPQRPRPGRPLRDEQVESHEGDAAATTQGPAEESPASEPTPPADETQRSPPGRREGGRRRGRRRRGGRNKRPREGGADGQAPASGA